MINRIAYKTTGFAVKTLSSVSRARIRIHDSANIQPPTVIYVVNHFTRMETVFLPYHILRLTDRPVWSLADYSLFVGVLKTFFDNVGVVSTKNPDRDQLIVRTLLTREADWIIFPEGMMVKDKKIIEKGKFMISYAGHKRPPHTGPATLALRTEFYRQRLRVLQQENPEEAKRILDQFCIDEPVETVINGATCIIPVNITYYPLRARENTLSRFAQTMVENLPGRVVEEIMTEGSMLLSGVDMDIRFGQPIQICPFLVEPIVQKDIHSADSIRFDDPIPSRNVLRKAAFEIMQQYMSAIYSMTTVNHDHLFASLLKMMPFKKISSMDMKRRVFLAATLDLPELGIFAHDTLKKDQTRLLTDDSYHKFDEFFAIAEEKGIIRRKGDLLIKDMTRFASPFDFHQVRIDNPISVMANEVEPLVKLQHRLRKLTRHPSFLLKHRIRKYFMLKAVSEFEKDYKIFYDGSDFLPKNAGKPFLFRGKSKKKGVLLIHGYLGSPRQVSELGVYLAERGFWVYAPRLKGHGTTPEDLSTRTREDWIASVHQGYAVISSICDRVVVGGFSTGAALGLLLSANIPEICGVFVVSPPRRLEDLSSIFSSAKDAWKRLVEAVRGGTTRKEFLDANPENPNVTYRRNPVAGIREVELLIETLDQKLPDIKVPAFIARSYHDPKADAKGTDRIYDRIGSIEKQYSIFNFNRHCILEGECSDIVHRAIGDFIARV